MHNLFLVSSPLQLLCAIEAKAHFKTKNNILVIVYYSGDTQSSIEHTEKVAALSEWDEVIRLNSASKQSKYKEYLALLKYLKQFEYDYIFAGHLGNIQKTVVASMKKEAFFIIDDGMVTLNLHKFAFNPNNKPKRTLKQKLKELRFTLLGYKTQMRDTINYFTYFDLQPYADEQIVKNRFEYLLSTHLGDLAQDDTVYFIGQSLLADNLLDKETFIAYMQKVIDSYHGKKIVFIPHRREKAPKELEALVGDNFRIEYFHGPVEIEFVLQKILPMHIASFCSSGLMTLKKIFPDAQYDAFVLEQEDLNKRKEGIKNAYRVLSEEGFSLITLKG